MSDKKLACDKFKNMLKKIDYLDDAYTSKQLDNDTIEIYVNGELRRIYKFKEYHILSCDPIRVDKDNPDRLGRLTFDGTDLFFMDMVVGKD